MYSGGKWRLTKCILKFNTRQENVITFDRILIEEQYPVTAHVPNFDYLTGYREFKRCEEVKRTLQNPFASRMAEFDTTPKPLRITDQGYIVLIEFRFGRNRDFLRYFHFRQSEDQEKGCPASFYTSSDNRERNMQKWNGNNRDYVRKKPLRHGCDWGDQRRSWGSFVKHNVHCNDVF